jgi:hypothetical protein
MSTIKKLKNYDKVIIVNRMCIGGLIAYEY